MKNFDLSGKTVLITGASRGIGKAAAFAFADAGANVALVARSLDDIAEIAGQIGDKALAIPCDVSRAAQVGAAVNATAQAFGGVDILVNNAGMLMQRDIKASGINPVSQLEWSDHVPPEWPAQTLVWMCTADADGYLGSDVSLRDPAIRAAVGLS